MSSSFRLKKSSVAQLMKSDEMNVILNKYGESVKGSAGSGYEVETKRLKKRSKTTVRAASREAIADSLRNNSLVKALLSLRK